MDEDITTSKYTRRGFIGSGILVALSGCINRGNDLPPPTYTDSETETRNSTNESTTSTVPTEVESLNEEQKQLIYLYKTARDSLLTTLDRTNTVLKLFDERSFEAADTSIGTAREDIRPARSIIGENQDTEIWNLAEEYTTSRSIAEINVYQSVRTLGNASDLVVSAINTLRDAESKRKAGNGDKYFELIEEAESKISQAETQIPPEATVIDEIQRSEGS